jgi:hypothetical protein
MELFSLHTSGCSHGLHKISKYEGNAIALKLIVGGAVLERREEQLKLTIEEYLEKEFGLELEKGKVQVLTHGIPIDLGLTLKQLLEEWNYNDGYCYLKLQCQS